jgi:hypothetical protein
MDTVQALLDRLLEPFGGRDDPRTTEFARDLRTLLDAPLDLSGDRKEP